MLDVSFRPHPQRHSRLLCDGEERADSCYADEVREERENEVKTVEEERAYQHAYYLLHPKPSTPEQRVAKIEYDRKYRIDHKEELMAASRDWAAGHRQYLRDYSKKRRATHKQEMADYRVLHKEERAVYNKAYTAGHLIESYMKVAKHRALKYGNTPKNELLTAAQWRNILDEYNHRCAYCGIKSEHLTMDHVSPLSRGGKHSASNVVPACKSCNGKKWAKTPEERFGLGVAA